MKYVHGIGVVKNNLKKTFVLAAAAILMVQSLTFALSVIFPSKANAITSEEVIYNAIASPLPSNSVSLGYQATSTSEFGDKITFAGTSRNLTAVDVTLSSWACETGNWTSGCSTTPGSTFSHPITLNIYEVDGSGNPGTLIATSTQDFNIPFRPSPDLTCGDARQWRDIAGACFNGLNHNITFNFAGVSIPNSIVYGIAYNTQSYGDAPLGVDGPYNSLNVSLNDSASAPYIGTDVTLDQMFWDSTYLGRPAGFTVDSGWTPYKISAKFTASSVEAGPCTTTSSVHTTNLSTWDLSQTRSAGHNEILSSGGLRIWTDTDATGSPDPRKAAGYYTTDFDLENAGNQTIDEALDYTAIAGIEPGLQLVVDFDDNGSPDGILVGEKVYGNHWWLANSSAQFVKDNSPNVGGGYGSEWYGTINEWLSKFPSASVKSIGYSLGSGVNGDGIINSINLGCTTYTFGLPPNTAPTVNFVSPTPTEGSVVNGLITPHVQATDDYGMSSYYIRLWKGAFESGLSNLVSNNCWSAPGGNLLGTVQDVTCPSIDSSSLNDGVYVLSAQFLDANGSWGTAFRTFTIDKTSPAIPVNLIWTPEGGTAMTSGGWTNVQKGILSWESTDTTVDRYKYYFWTDIPGYFEGEANAWTTEGATYISETPSGGSIWTDFYDKQGTYFFCIKAIDVVGNSSDCSDTFSVTYDNTAPGVPVHVSPANNSVQNFNNFWFDWDDVSGASSYEIQYSLNSTTNPDGSFVSVDWYGDASHVQPTNSQAWSSGANGTWYWQVRSVDLANNKSAWSTPWKMTIDMVAPNIPSALFTQDSNGAGVLSGGVTNSQYFTFNLTSSPDVVRYQLRYYNDIVGSPFKHVSPWNPTDLSGYSPVLGTYKDNFTQGNGVHYFEFSACDQAGNCSAYSSPFEITFDTTPPVSNFAGLTTTDTTPTLSGTVDDDSATVKVTVDGVEYTAAVSSGTWSIADNVLSALSVGVYDVTISSTDVAGNNAVQNFANSLTISPVSVPTVQGVNTGNNSNQGNQQSQSSSNNTPAPSARAVATNSSNSSFDEDEETADETIDEQTGEVKQAVTENTSAEQGEENSGSESSNNWWLWVVIAIIVAGLLYFLYKNLKDDEAEK